MSRPPDSLYAFAMQERLQGQREGLAAARQGDVQVDPGADWRSTARRRGDVYVGDELTISCVLRADAKLRGIVRLNEFSQSIECGRSLPWRECKPGEPWTDRDEGDFQIHLQSMRIDARSRAAVSTAIVSVAAENAFHPLREELDGLRWDGQERLATWLSTYLHAVGKEQYLRVVGPKAILQLVARVFHPGCQADHVLVLEGPQGIGKSSTVRTLARRAEWFADRLPDLHSADAALQLRGKWIIELPELTAIRRAASIESVKAYLTRTSDVYRPPYGRHTMTVPRQSCFVATTNEGHYLQDRTGNRRFWPVRCGDSIDVDGLLRDRDQLYAEAVRLLKAGAIWHLADHEAPLAATEQRDRMMVTELESQVSEYLGRLLEAKPTPITEVLMRQVFVEALHLEPDKSDYSERAQRLGPSVAAAMEAVSWRRVGRSERGGEKGTLWRYCGGGQVPTG